MVNTETIIKKCMETDKPLVSILMAIYEPRMDWLKEQLNSLNAQTYPNLRLYIRDDCSPTVAYSEIKETVAKFITAFPCIIQRNERNLGSNMTFERLTQEAEGDYFAYCDQDDVWLPEKISVLQEFMERERAELVCSDMFIIDEYGKQTATSITKVRKHHVFHSGYGLAANLLISNFVTGCAMLVRSETARASVPFCPYMVHDHYIALYCAQKGKIVSMARQTIYYRIHSGNQTLMMAGVYNKESYYNVRIVALVNRLKWLKERFENDKKLNLEIMQALEWAEARRMCFRGDIEAKKTVLKYRRFSPLTSLFEIFLSWTPQWMFMFFIKLKRRNII